MHNQLFAPSFPSISHHTTTELSNKIYYHQIVRAFLINAYSENFKSEIPLLPFLLQGGPVNCTQRADFRRADLCCQLCPGHLGDPQKVTASVPLNTWNNGTVLNTLRFTDYLLDVFSCFFLLFHWCPWWTKHKACRMDQRNLLPHLPSCLQISKQLPAKIPVLQVVVGKFLCKLKANTSVQKVYDNSWCSFLEVLQVWFNCLSWPCCSGTEWPRRQLWTNWIWDILYETSSNLEKLPNVPEI